MPPKSELLLRWPVVTESATYPPPSRLFQAGACTVSQQVEVPPTRQRQEQPRHWGVTPRPPARLAHSSRDRLGSTRHVDLTLFQPRVSQRPLPPRHYCCRWHRQCYSRSRRWSCSLYDRPGLKHSPFRRPRKHLVAAWAAEAGGGWVVLFPSVGFSVSLLLLLLVLLFASLSYAAFVPSRRQPR